MPFRFPRRSFHGGRNIYTYSLDSLPADDGLPRDPTSVRFRSIAAILLGGIRRCAALDGDFDQLLTKDEPILDNLGDSLVESLDFVSDKPHSVSDVSKTLGFWAERDIHNGGNL